MKSIFKNKPRAIICLIVIFNVLPVIAQAQTSEQKQEEVQWQSQDKTQIYIATDIVSQYIWRGLDYGGVSIKPSISIVKKGFSFSAYGNAGFDTNDTKTLGLTLGYQWKGLKAMVTDFWYSDAFTPEGKFPSTYFEYGAHNTTHIYEALLGYDFKYITVEWNTIFGGYDYYKSNGKRAYSSYIEVAAPFHISMVDFRAYVGITPWESYYADGFNVVNTGIKAVKTFYIKDKLAIPVSAEIIANPYTEQVYMVAGVGFHF